MTSVVTFQDALAAVGQAKHMHALLGNGFSRAWRDDVFSYDALFDEAAKRGLSDAARRAFGALSTTDFELVMRALRQASRLASAFSSPTLATELSDIADALRELLVTTIASKHPDRPHAVTPGQYEACRKFLSPFSNIYTLNYDLLLYWTVMQRELEPQIGCDDGFRMPYGGPQEYVTWEIEKTNQQNIHYLHGALHVFDAGSEVQKYTWSNTQVALIDQIRDALLQHKYPLFVSEGTSDSKLDRIQHSSYLGRAYRSFANCSHGLIIFGLAMAENDEHILRLLDHGAFTHIGVGLYGDPSTMANAHIIARTQAFGSKRKKNPTVVYFDSDSAAVWGP